jgi:plastocyanin
VNSWFFQAAAGAKVRPMAALALILAAGGQISAATVTGYTRLVQSADSAVKKKGDFSGVVVWLGPSQDSLTQVVRKHAQMIQKDKRFSPHILVIETGTSVDFPNLDPMFHNAFSNYDGKIFDVALYPPGSSRTVKFDRSGIVRVFCNIHPSMSAIIVVLDSNHFATTDTKGRYVLPRVSAGKYVLHFFHERATPEVLSNLSQTIVVSGGDEPQEIGTTTISEAGYLPVAHKNKYGRDYPVDADKVDGYAVHMK